MQKDISDCPGISSVRAICPRRGGGRVVTMGFPGLDMDARGDAWLNPERMDATLNEATNAGARLLLVHASSTELPAGALALLRRNARARGLRVIGLPIEDYSVPGEPFLRAWRRLRPLFDSIFDDDGAVGISCHHGAGRSGVTAAMHLIDAGDPPAEAVTMLRNQFPETVENDTQFQWLERYAEAIGGRFG